MLKLPYDLSEFSDIVRDGYLYLDRTRFIRVLEELGRVLLFVRPRRFGKSLWLRTLRCYYDLNLAGEFDELFGNLLIGRNPTPLHNRYFVLLLDLSVVDPSGPADRITRSLAAHVNARAKRFAVYYRQHLPAPVEVAEDPASTLESMLGAVQETPYKLYLLIDEYDNFVNEVMVSDTTTYHDLVHSDGPFKQLFKSVKAALGEGLERVFITGISPVALNDVTSGFNIARNVSGYQELSTLCGFTEDELQSVLPRLGRQMSAEIAGNAMQAMRTWYNGYRFSADSEEPVYNPTNSLYFLDHLQRRGSFPETMQDHNLASDEDKLRFLSRLTTGSQVIVDLVQERGEIAVDRLEDRFTLRALVEEVERDAHLVASFLYYLGMLTQLGRAPLSKLKLGIPNLVVKKLYVDQLARLLLPQGNTLERSRRAVDTFLRSGELTPFVHFIEQALFPIFSTRDYRWQAEMAVKAALLTLLFDDTRYAVYSELEAAHGFADLCLLVRPDARGGDLHDLLFELKYVKLKELGMSGAQVLGLEEQELRALEPVRKALGEAAAQVHRYQEALQKTFGGQLQLRCFALVAVGFEKLVGDQVSGSGEQE
jgi:hypothetical protein